MEVLTGGACESMGEVVAKCGGLAALSSSKFCVGCAARGLA